MWICLRQAGVEVPTTWAELEDVCQALVDFYGGDVYPWGIDMTTDEGQAAFAYYAWGNGGGFVDDEGNWTVNSDANVEAVEFAVDLYKKGYTNPNPATQTRYDLQDMFGAGKLAMVIAPNSLPTYIADKGYTNVNYAVADIPHNEGKTSSCCGRYGPHHGVQGRQRAGSGRPQRGHRQVPDVLLRSGELRGLGQHGRLPAGRRTPLWRRWLRRTRPSRRG